MRFEIEAVPAGGLRVIPLIPDVGPICQIEGRNGVGKSVALRLLELCTGTQPYARDPDSWATLRDQLGPTIVRAFDLADDKVITWHLNPPAWPTTPDPVDEWLGTVEIDGAVARLADARQFVQVIHHSGDLTLEATIRDRIARDRRAVALVRDHFASHEHAVGERLDALRRDLVRADYDELSRLSARVEEERAVAAEAAATVERARVAKESVERALALREQQQRVRDDVPTLEARERELNEEINAAAATVTDIEGRHNELRAQHRRDEALTKQIEELERTVKGRLTRAETAREKAVRAAAELGFSPDRPFVAAALEEARSEREALVRERDLIDATPRIRQLADDLSSRLDTRRAHELDDQTLARIGDTSLSVRALREGVDIRRAELAAYEPEPPAAALEERIRLLTARTARLSTLDDLLGKADRAQELAAESQDELQRLTELLPAEEAAQLQRIERDLADARGQHLALVEARAIVRGQITEIVGGGAEAGAQELAQLLGALQTTEPELERLLATRATDLDERLREQTVAQAALLDAQRQIQLARAEFDQAIAVLEQGDDYSWLRADGVPLPQFDLAEEENGRRLTELRRVVGALERQLDDARETLRAVDGALEVWASRDRVAERATATGQAVRRHYEAVFGSELSGREIVDAIFDSGEFVNLDLAALAVTWRTDEGELRTRPLSAFSSGERAFAYTRTRLQALGSQAKNTVVALDEFGAFLARDRLKQLVAFLEHDVVGTIADEVIIVLPLLRDYEAELDETTGALRDELEGRVADLRATGYFVRAPDWSTV